MTFLFHRLSSRRLSRGGPRRRTLAVQSLETRRLLAGDLTPNSLSLQAPGPDIGAAPISRLDPAGSAAEAAQPQVRQDAQRSGEGEAPDSVHFRFIYPADADPAGFFLKFPQAKTLLEEAGRRLTDRLADKLDAITPLPTGVTWTANYNNPATGTSKAVPAGFTVGANEIVVFVGTRNLQSLDPPGSAGAVRAFAKGIDDSRYTCPLAVCDAVEKRLTTRGEANTQGPGAVDFAPILGSLTFDSRASSVNNLYFEQGAIQPDQLRFLTLAQHELAHLLGFGIAPSFQAARSGSNFVGTQATQVYGGPVPLAPPTGSHLNGSLANAGLTIMGPSIISQGLFTELDFAVLHDIGWEVVADPRPTVTLDTPDLVVVENAGTIEITATLSKASPSKITLPVSLTGAAATATDVRLSPPSFVFEANQRTAKITVTIVNDNVKESTETVTMSLREIASVKLGVKTDFRLTIFDDDGVVLSKVPRIDSTSITTSVDIPGDNKPHGIVFRAAANRTLSVMANNVDQISEAVLLIDQDRNVIGSYGPQGLVSTSLIAGQSYAVVFYPRQTSRTFTVSLPGGFAAATPRTNVLFRPDVNGDYGVTEVDALQIINQLNRAQNDSSIDAATVTGEGFYDVSGDGYLTAVDALQVINYLNDPSNPRGEPVGPTVGSTAAADLFSSAEPSRSDTNERASGHLEYGRFGMPLHAPAKRVDASSSTSITGSVLCVNAVDRAIEEEGRRADSITTSPRSRLRSGFLPDGESQLFSVAIARPLIASVGFRWLDHNREVSS